MDKQKQEFLRFVLQGQTLKAAAASAGLSLKVALGYLEEEKEAASTKINLALNRSVEVALSALVQLVDCSVEDGDKIAAARAILSYKPPVIAVSRPEERGSFQPTLWDFTKKDA